MLWDVCSPYTIQDIRYQLPRFMHANRENLAKNVWRKKWTFHEFDSCEDRKWVGCQLDRPKAHLTNIFSAIRAAFSSDLDALSTVSFLKLNESLPEPRWNGLSIFIFQRNALIVWPPLGSGSRTESWIQENVVWQPCNSVIFTVGRMNLRWDYPPIGLSDTNGLGLQDAPQADHSLNFD